MKLIKMDGLIDELTAAVARDELSGREFSIVKRYIMRQDAVDAVEVVRCKDCAWVTLNAESNRYWCSYYLGALEVKATNFCGLAKRKNDYGSDAERREP